jgi:phospho-N-acetylmuramoyl-pentapeptide-transferase
MLYLIIDQLRDYLAAHPLLGALGVFRWVEFRAVLAIAVSFTLVVGFGNRTIGWLVRQKIGDTGNFDHDRLQVLLQEKTNTPTMGGILIAGSILVTTLLLANLGRFYVSMALICLIALTAIGIADDWLKLTTARRKPGARQGLYTWEKLVLQLGLAVVLALFIHHHGMNKQHFLDENVAQISHSFTVPFFKTWTLTDGVWEPTPLIVLGTWAFVLLATGFIAGTSNAVNLTDGMDGLAAGMMAIVAFAFLVLAFIAGYQNPETDFVLAKYLLVPYIPFSDELAVVAGAMVGACLGFLWFNCYPAKVFMGDTGSLPLGGLIAYIAVVIRQELLLLIIGGVFFFEMLSVVMQVGYFKATGGRRIFRCAPVHHHFHLGGWTEQQVVVRFWIITALLSAIALATIKIR